MKIISGKWGGQSLPQKVNPKMRPTTDKVREAVFDILEARIVKDWSGLRILDLFAGTGAFGIEALSRGASQVTFVDNHLRSTKALEKVLLEFELGESTEVICKGVLDAISWLHRQGRQFPLIFMDPPYRQDWVVATLNKILEAPVISTRGIIVAEHDKRESLTALQGFWNLVDSRRYGDTCISFFCFRKSYSYWQNRFSS